MHEELFPLLQETVLNGISDNIAQAAPRGNAKSTLVSLALAIWCALYEHKHYILLVSDTADQANDFLSNIKTEMETNEHLMEDFLITEGAVWTNTNLILNNGVRIQALGAGKKVRGRRHMQYRPDLIIGDDLENDESVANPDQRKKTMSWYNRALSKAGDERTDKIIIGTIIHQESLLANLLRNPTYKSNKYKSVLAFSSSPLWTDWENIVTNLENPNRLIDGRAFFDSNKEPMLVGTQVLWEQKEDYYSLMLQRLAEGPAAFSSEKQNEPISDDERRFDISWIRYYEQSEIMGKNLMVVGYIDPSLGKMGGDYSAIIIVGMDNNGIIYILVADIQKRHPDLIISDALSLHRDYRMSILGIEAQVFQEYFKDNAVKALTELEQEDRSLSVAIKGVKVHRDKILRIQSLQPDIKSGRIRFRKDQQKLIEQLTGFPTADHDDGPDALHGAVQMLGKGAAIRQFYREQVDESKTQNLNSFLQNPSLQRLN